MIVIILVCCYEGCGVRVVAGADWKRELAVVASQFVGVVAGKVVTRTRVYGYVVDTADRPEELILQVPGQDLEALVAEPIYTLHFKCDGRWEV